MHELSLAESMRELIEQQQCEQGFDRVTLVNLEVGQLSHVSADAMAFCFDSVMLGSVAEGASLKIIDQAGLAKCPSCGNRCAIEQLYDPCPKCGAFGLSVLQGDQVRIRSIEVI